MAFFDTLAEGMARWNAILSGVYRGTLDPGNMGNSPAPVPVPASPDYQFMQSYLFSPSSQAVLGFHPNYEDTSMMLTSYGLGGNTGGQVAYGDQVPDAFSADWTTQVNTKNGAYNWTDNANFVVNRNVRDPRGADYLDLRGVYTS